MLERGAYDKAGHDLSDVYRGRIQIMKELLDFKDVVLNQKKVLDEQANEEKKKGAGNGVE